MRESCGERFLALSSRIHAAMAQLASLAIELDSSREWEGMGLRSCVDWISVNAGFDTWHARELLRVGDALKRLPLIAEAFSTGRLSFDKARHLTLVAQPGDEHLWLRIGLTSSGNQCARIVRSFRTSAGADDPDRAAAQQYRRRLSTWWRDDGMLDLFISLPPEDGSIVLSAVEAVMQRGDARRPVECHPAEQPWLARRADALVDVCRQWLAGDAATGDDTSGSRELVVHVDAATLTLGEKDGRCHIQDGPAISAAAARRIGCDAEVVAVIEKGGVPVHVGRSRRIVSARQRRAVQIRDETCRYPGCPVPARDTECHHVIHWLDHGETELSNILSLCRFHHHRYHEGAFRITTSPDGDFNFLTAAGIPIATPPRAVDPLRETAPWLASLPVRGRPMDGSEEAVSGLSGSLTAPEPVRSVELEAQVPAVATASARPVPP